MKLVKSLLLGSAAGLAAVASAQAADLPFRKAAPVDYVRVCDWVSGGGYFYIPGTDTCLKVGGEVRAEFAYNEPNNTFSAFSTAAGGGSTFGAGAAAGGAFVNTPGAGLAFGNYSRGRVQNESGFFVRTKLELDARTQTAYGLFRANVRAQLTFTSGDYAGTTGGGPSNFNQVATTIDRGYITFAGITAGRLQSFFDFYADNYNYEGIATSDQSSNVFAYTATFGGGFSATVSVEDPTFRRNGIGNLGNDTGFAGLGVGGLGTVGANFSGQRVPDVVGQVRYDQAWGAIQLSGAYHEVDTFSTTALAPAAVTRNESGYAFRGGVDVKLPMIAAGDELWLEGGYQSGAYLYQDSGAGVNNGFYGNLTGGFVQGDPDAVAIPTGAGGYRLRLGSGFSALAAFHHYFTPQFHDVLFGSYEEQGYGNVVRNTDWRLGGIGDQSQYKIGNQFIFTPVHNLDIGLEVMYAKVNQDIPGMSKATFRTLVPGVATDPDAFRVTLHFNRDF